jgi:cellulose biosynthesis protein BcsQ
MSVVAIYNMKGGVGKTTTAVNLSYLAAAEGQRTLLWDLDPQGASSFAFRIRPRVAGFGKKSLESGMALATAIRATDYDNLDVLPADFAYRKLDRLLAHVGEPARVMTALLDMLGHDYDAVFLDCPAGFSLLTESVFAAADAVLMPTIPTVLSLRMVARIIKWADRSDSPSELTAFFNMVDRRKTLHRRACDWSAGHPEVLLAGQIPYASVVEQMTVRRMPLGAFAARDVAATAFAGIWSELLARLRQRKEESQRPRDASGRLLRAIESLIVWLESAGSGVHEAGSRQAAVEMDGNGGTGGHREVERPSSSTAESDASVGSALERNSHSAGDFDFVHRFDTDGRDLQRRGYVLELRERTGSLRVVAARSGSGDDAADTGIRVEAHIDGCWAMEILSGVISPLEALGRRLDTPKPLLFENIVAIVSDRKLLRVGSRAAGSSRADDCQHLPRPSARTVFNEARAVVPPEGRWTASESDSSV